MKPNSHALACALVSLALPAAALFAPVAGQVPGKKMLDHEDYDVWVRISGETLSPDGDWLAHVESRREGDGTLVLQSLRGNVTLRYERGGAPQFTDDSRYLVFMIEPAEAVVDSLREADVRANRLPRDTLAILALADLSGAGDATSVQLTRVPRVRSVRLADDASTVIAYHLEAPPPEEGEGREQQEETPPAEPEQEQEEAEEGPDRDKAEGTTLVLRRLASGEIREYPDVTAFLLTDDGTRLIYAASNEEGTADGVYVVDTGSMEPRPILAGEGEYTDLTLDEEQTRLAFLTNRDDWQSDAEEPDFALYRADLGGGQAVLVANSTTPGVPEGWQVSDNGNLRFSEDGSRLFFGTAPRPRPEPEEVPEDERVVVDIWNWRDPLLQPQQLVQRQRELNRSYLALAQLDGSGIVQLEDQSLESVDVGDGTGAFGVGEDNEPYAQLRSWDGTYNDIYLVDLSDGSRRLVKEGHRGGANLSPGERYLFWWDSDELAWYTQPVAGGPAVKATAGLPHPVHDVFDDTPAPPGSQGFGGWTEGDGGLVIYDQYDIWKVDPSGRAAPVNLTEGEGRANGLRFRYIEIDPELDVIPEDEEVLLSAFDMRTKSEGYYRDHFGTRARPTRLVWENASIGRPEKAEDADVFLFTKETFQTFPDLWVSDASFGGMRKVTDANPQQSEYSWGTAEIVEWLSTDGEELQGILYKPEGFDPSQQYPMMVYFYERSSDGLHNYTVPSPGTSINRSFYVSRGYLLFVPDITYKVGYPGESAMDDVVPGILSLIDEGFVDREKIGVQGHSWGGYQISYMVTQTDIFAAAEAGAPVSNMTSAYGGIRWSSGLSRMFQYEQTQSRIGGTLWETPIRYIENSPLFFADKINTPILILHNDEDGAVPWYQGIEFFVALRRLGKPAWLLNYNGEDHGLRRDANTRDWTIRMQQFFDHYLKDAPPPVWMVEGVPATLKGIDLGLELVRKGISEEGGSGS